VSVFVFIFLLGESPVFGGCFITFLARCGWQPLRSNIHDFLTSADVEQISQLGRPAWILDGMLDHDTFAKSGRDAFPGIPFLAPAGFESLVDFPIESLRLPPSQWGDELQVMKLSGVPSFSEHVFLHSPSKTLIVCDLLFNFHPRRDFGLHCC